MTDVLEPCSLTPPSNGAGDLTAGEEIHPGEYPLELPPDPATNYIEPPPNAPNEPTLDSGVLISDAQVRIRFPGAHIHPAGAPMTDYRALMRRAHGHE